MDVTNKTTFPIIAMCWHTMYGYGDEKTIEPGQSEDILGSYIGEMGGGKCHLIKEGKITIHEAPDDESGYHVSKGHQLNFGNEESGVTVRHHSDDLELG